MSDSPETGKAAGGASEGISKGGRPSAYTPELAELILSRLASGESVRSICRSEGIPERTTVARWVVQDIDGFASRWARARELGLEEMADETQEIADDGTNDWMERNGSDDEGSGWRVNGEHIQRSKLRVDTRKWLLAKRLPKQYGDKSEVVLTGPNGGPITTAAIVTDDPAEAARAYQRIISGEG